MELSKEQAGARLLEAWQTETGQEVLLVGAYPTYVLAVPVVQEAFYVNFPLANGRQAVVPLVAGMDRRVLTRRTASQKETASLEALKLAEECFEGEGGKHPVYHYVLPPKSTQAHELFEEELHKLMEKMNDLCFRYDEGYYNE